MYVKYLIPVAQFGLSRYSLIIRQSVSYYSSLVAASDFENVKKRVSSWDIRSSVLLRSTDW